MAWPLAQDYNEAIQNPQSSFSDPDLRVSQTVLNAVGLPMPCSGNFADVYEMRGPDGKRWAVKCFTRQVSGLRERYRAISRQLEQARLPFIVEFQFLEEGIRIHGQWFPVVKMQWVQGQTLNQFVRENLNRPTILEALGQIWQRLALRLRDAQLAHADLQHGNVLLVPGNSAQSLGLKLIDYDGMVVPALLNQPSGEAGHTAYQHPQRLREGTYHLDLDRFPLLVIATALRCVTVAGRSLWERYDNGDNLLFRKEDLEAPRESALFQDLGRLDDEQARTFVRHLRLACEGRLEDTPVLDHISVNGKAPTSQTKPAPVPRATSVAPSGDAAQSPFANLVDPAAQAYSPPARRDKTKTARSWHLWLSVGLGAAVIALAVLRPWANRTPPSPHIPPGTDPGDTTSHKGSSVNEIPLPDKKSLVLSRLPEELRLVAGEPGQDVTLEVTRQTLNGGLRFAFHDLPPGVKAEPVPEKSDKDSQVWRLKAELDTPTGRAEVTVVAAVDDVSARGRFPLLVVQPPLPTPDFGLGRPIIRGTWSVENEELIQNEVAKNVHQSPGLFFGDPEWTDYVVSFDCQKTSGIHGFSLLFRARRSDHCLGFAIGGWNNSKHALQMAEAGKGFRLLHEKPGSFKPGQWYRVRLEVRGQRVKCEIDNQPVFDTELACPRHRSGGIGIDTLIGLRVKNLQVTDPDGKALFSGLLAIDSAGKQIPVKPILVEAAKLPPGSILGRRGIERQELLKESEATKEAEEAIKSGLAWIVSKRHNAPKTSLGTYCSWSLDGYDEGHGFMKSDVAATGLALLPLLGQENPFGGDHDLIIRNGLRFLCIKQNAKDGSLGDGAMWAHGIATMALVEAYALGDAKLQKELRPYVQRALQFTALAQHHGGGWREQRGQNGVVHWSVWPVMTLKTAEMAGLTIDQATWKKTIKFLEAVTDPVRGGFKDEDSLQSRRENENSWAAGLLCRTNLGWRIDQPEAARILERLSEIRPRSRQNPYYRYHASLVMRHAGGKRWREWYAEISKDLIAAQERGPTHKEVSWAPFGQDRGKEFGRLYVTSLSLLTLQAPYRYVPLYLSKD